MAQTTIDLGPELEVLLKLEAARRQRPVEELMREALHNYLAAVPRPIPPGAGSFASGHSTTAARAEEVLHELGFGKGTA
jgi:plasmid stability protein